MPAAKTATPAPATPAQASLYQQLRGHLATLKLHDAAEALPAVLDQARTEDLTMTAALERTTVAALLDRLLHRSVVLTLDGDSYRLRDHHARADTLRATTTGTRKPLR
jgi:hypothetical protein